MFYRKVRDEVEVTNSSYLIREQEGIRILVAFEDDYRAYREVIAAGIGLLRPSIEVATTGSEELAQEIARINPQVVVSSQSEATSPAPVQAWVHVPTDPAQPAEVLFGGRRRTVSELTLEALLAIIDEAEQSQPL